jgi:hypothetical protein
VFSVILASALVLVLLVSVQSFTASASAPNVTVSESKTLAVTGGEVSANFATTDMNVTISGLLPGSTRSVNLTTQTLNAPSSGVLNVSSSGTVLYYNINIPLPVAVYNYAADPNAVVTISVSNPLIASSECTFEFWNGTAWSAALRQSVSGTIITGLVPLSNLIGVFGNLAVVKAQAISATSTSTAPVVATSTTSTSTSMSSISVALLAVGVVVIVIIVAAGLMLMRGRGKAKPGPAKSPA